MTSTYTVPLRWRDMDAQKHLYHAVYLTLLDEGRSAWIRQGLQLPGFDNHVLAHLSIDYVSEVDVRSEEVDMTFAVKRVGSKSFTTQEVMTVDGGRVAAKVSAVLVGFDEATRSGVALTAAQRSVLEQAQKDAGLSQD